MLNLHSSSSFHSESMKPNNLVNLPRLQYISESSNENSQQQNHGILSVRNNTKKLFLPGTCRQMIIFTKAHTICSGRDYYDESLSKQNTMWNNLEHRVQQRTDDQEDWVYEDNTYQSSFMNTSQSPQLFNYPTLSSPAQRRKHQTENQNSSTATFPQYRQYRTKNTNLKVKKNNIIHLYHLFLYFRNHMNSSDLKHHLHKRKFIIRMIKKMIPG